MNKFLKLLSITLVSVFTLSACQAPTEEQEQPEKESVPQIKEVEIFDVSQKNTGIVITTYGSVEAETSETVTAQTAGQISNKNIDVGEYITANTKAFEINNSLQSEINEINYQTALANERIARDNNQLTKLAAKQSVDSAELSINTTLRNYRSAQTTRENTIQLFEDQWENSQIEIDNAEIGLETAEDSYDNLLDQIDDLEDDLFDLDDDINDTDDLALRSQLIAQEEALENQLDNLENQLDSLRNNIEIAENRVEQSKLAKAQLEDNYRNQFNQINTNIDQSYNQYLQALNQLEASQTALYLQANSADSQLINSRTSRQINEANLKFNTVKNTTEGTVAEIFVKEGDYVNPGTPLFTVNNKESLKITATINKNQEKFVKIGQNAFVYGNSQTYLAKVTNISPTVNANTLKTEIEISILESEGLKVGDYLKVDIQVNSEEDIFIPLESLYLNDDKTQARTLKGNKAHYKTVQIGEILGEYIEIKSGLKTTDKVIQNSELSLEEGEEVKVIQN
jgi:RND family efflux transporter MFP subunit